MNAPLPEHLRGVKPGESPQASLRGRIILFEFPHDERFPNQLIRQWKITQGCLPNSGIVMKTRYQSDQRHHWRTKHGQYMVWMGNERALIDAESAMVFKTSSLYRNWRAKQELIQPHSWVYPLLYRHTDPMANQQTGEILVLIKSTSAD